MWVLGCIADRGVTSVALASPSYGGQEPARYGSQDNHPSLSASQSYGGQEPARYGGFRRDRLYAGIGHVRTAVASVSRGKPAAIYRKKESLRLNGIYA